MSSGMLPLIIAGVLLALYFAYRAALPKPLPHIPYNRDAASNILGDIPEMIRYVLRTKRMFCWLASLNARHQSPIIQAFIKPMGLPWVVVTDPLESQDILLRRTKEFDRSGFFGELIGDVLPEQHIQFLSTDPRFKNGRNLINHLMAPTFVNQISGPAVYNSIYTLIKVWQAKCDVAQGRPFDVHHDLIYSSLDAIVASSFGLPETDSTTFQRLVALSRSNPEIPADENTPISFPDGTIPKLFSAVLDLEGSITIASRSPAPALARSILGQFPYMRRAKAIKDEYIRDKIRESLALIEDDGNATPPQGGRNTTTTPRISALHSVLLREREIAAKEDRQPDYFQRPIFDEFLGLVMAGHDTEATTSAWGMKYLADHPAAQAKLRSELRKALPDALREKRSPTYDELIRTHIPYLDAVVEEILRHANTVPFVVRRAMRDGAVVLGRRIPKGTDVFLMANGPSYLQPNLEIDDDDDDDGIRSPEARRRGQQGRKKTTLTGLWDDGDISKFLPERWLREDPAHAGTVAFDPMAGPTLAFGLGPRGCFGKRLALQALKMRFALTCWHFTLRKTPPELSGYDAVQKFAREPTQCYVRLESTRF
ncbi:cytochrome P450 [Xylariomycetidae sp. FL2044]|nr:cytochrome P450 [Xylariomycetidae sp. FL2044]